MEAPEALTGPRVALQGHHGLGRRALAGRRGGPGPPQKKNLKKKFEKKFVKFFLRHIFFCPLPEGLLRFSIEFSNLEQN